MPEVHPRPSPLVATLALVGVLTAARLATLFATPLELYPDEAQYWLWSRTLDWGYYSKPPMVAWLIALTTAIGGDSEPWVRVSALWLHAGAGLALFAAGNRAYGVWTGFWASAIYSLMPGVQLSSGVIATDAPLLFFLAVALLAYVSLQKSGSRIAAFGFGAAVGAAALSKYAAVYFLAGVALHVVVDPEARRAWRLGRIMAAAAGLAVVLAPNMIWNAYNGFATVTHTAANANWNAADRFNAEELVDFIGAQFGVFGPLPFAVLIAASIVLAIRGRLQAPDRMLLCFVLPPLLIVAVQAFITRANANWAAAAYAPASVLVAAWLVRWNARKTLGVLAVSQGVLAAVFFAAAASPQIADGLGLANSFKRARGWEETTAAVLERAAREDDLSAVAVDDRFYYNALAYYGRNAWARPGAAPLRMWVREAEPQNQAETTAPLDTATGRQVLAVSGVTDFRAEFKRDFASVAAPQDSSVRLDARRTRDFQLFIGKRFVRQPRDPVTGLPTISARQP